MSRIIWMFAGQGSQYPQMGRDLFEKEPVFRESMERGDALVQRLTGQSVVDVVYRPRSIRAAGLERVLTSHPGIIMLEFSLAQLLFSRGVRPDCLLGYSLGEFAALAVAGSLAYEEVLTLAIKQAALLEYCAKPGAMLAILESAEVLNQRPGGLFGCKIVSWNFPKNVIAVGSPAEVEQLFASLKEEGIGCLRLPVGFSFHSEGMDVIRAPFEAASKMIEIKAPSIPVFSGERGDFLSRLAAEHFWSVTRQSIDLPRGIRRLETEGPNLYIDLGPSGSMATCVKYNLQPGSQSESLSIMTPFGNETRTLQRALERHQTPFKKQQPT